MFITATEKKALLDLSINLEREARRQRPETPQEKTSLYAAVASNFEGDFTSAMSLFFGFTYGDIAYLCRELAPLDIIAGKITGDKGQSDAEAMLGKLILDCVRNLVGPNCERKENFILRSHLAHSIVLNHFSQPLYEKLGEAWGF